MLVKVLGIRNSTIVFTLFGLRKVPDFPTTSPNNMIYLTENIHLLVLSFIFTSFNLCNIIQMWLRCASHVTLWILRSSINTSSNFYNHSEKMLVIILENILVASFNLNGIISHSYCFVLVINVVFFTLSGFIMIFQKPLYKSKAVNHYANPI
jgi:hypothetical protein